MVTASCRRSSLLLSSVVILLASCSGDIDTNDWSAKMNVSSQLQTEPSDALAKARRIMVATQLASRDITNERVLDVLGRVPRHLFVPQQRRRRAYQDRPLPIGEGQTISQPYIVALMTQLVDPQPDHRALDVGTGSGYQAAVLAELVRDVYSIEIVESLAAEAKVRLEQQRYQNIALRQGDGYHGWESAAPFDCIIVAAAPEKVPQALIDQLALGGKLVIPVGTRFQNLLLIQKDLQGDVSEQVIAPVAFVPMTGEAEK